MNKLLLISGRGQYIPEIIKIPNNTTILYLSSDTKEIDLYEMKKYNIQNLEYNNTDSINFYEYKSGEMIHNNYFNIFNGVYDDLKVIQGLYELPMVSEIIDTINVNIGYIEKESIEKSLMNTSKRKINFSLSDIFNDIIKENNKKIIDRKIIILASRNPIILNELIQ